MILKSFEINDKKISNFKIFLFYGANQGLKEEIIQQYFKKNSEKVLNYNETEVLNNLESFYAETLSNSFFENKKLIIISGSSEKILKIIEEISNKEIGETKIILITQILDLRSKLRKFFEKAKNLICVPFYEDNNQTLIKICQNFFKEKKINISQQSINLIVERCNGDRINLKNELKKVESFSKNKKSIEFDEISQLTNLIENYSITELIDNSLAKNKKRTLNILNENNFSSEDCIMISRIYLARLKRLLNLHSMLEVNGNIDNTISSYKPPIFWKEKDIVKKQIQTTNHEIVENLMIKTNELEHLVKKKPSMSINIVTDFIIDQVN